MLSSTEYESMASLTRSIMQRWMKLSAAYSESPLRVGCLEWPLRVSPSHALQLQATAALRALHPVKSRHAQVSCTRVLPRKIFSREGEISKEEGEIVKG